MAEKFETYAKKSEVVCDLGAHVGYYTLLASKAVGKCGKVYAFEPLPWNIIYLKKHIELNNISNVCIFDCAVSNVTGKISFTNGDNKVSNTIGKNSPMFQSGKLIEVNSVTLDDLLEKDDIMVPQLIKMDIEGAEYDALTKSLVLLTDLPTPNSPIITQYL
ncbi:MAG: FkbM family methyltransferase [Methanophagales archaeon]|nr:FkbM family methyltransferase [Methanophagales archaeon]